MYLRAAEKLREIRKEAFQEIVTLAVGSEHGKEMLIAAYSDFRDYQVVTKDAAIKWCENTYEGALFSVSWQMRAASASMTDQNCLDAWSNMGPHDAEMIRAYQAAMMGEDYRLVCNWMDRALATHDHESIALIDLVMNEPESEG